MRPPTPKEMAQLTTTPMALLSKVLGKKLMTRTLATMSDGSAWLRAPQTTMETLKDLFEEARPIDEREIEEFAEPRMRRFNDVVQRCLATNPILLGRTPASLMRFLVQHANHVDTVRLEALKFDGLIDVVIPAEMVPPMVLETGNLFEPTVREAGRFLCGSIERWYKAFLTFLVDLTCSAHQRQRPADTGPRTTLGGWCRAAHRLWDPADGPTCVLDVGLVRLRNFFSHEELRVDVRAQTVVSPLDASRVLDREGFALVLRAHYFKLCAMWFVLLAWAHRYEMNDRGTDETLSR